ncbi:MAG: nicotinate-nucleotide--dimethylbenzimidazole phosphoribosyltransferase [Anaerolineae bacterium]|jgi:nicotinate-nucleotide--dimethylbenzimidazole phosphoribosyltransferase|nr:nicotinate-nucleotide--dimethylbenzimidazole phosphoribosyltransferase [Anaerolineae bacterium]
MHFEAPTIPSFDHNSANAVRNRQNSLIKPAGSLGRLEEISVQIAGIQGVATPSVKKKSVIVMAGDHGVSIEGVSAFPSNVTQQMVGGILMGKAAINAIAGYTGANVRLIDMGVDFDFPETMNLENRKVHRGTANMAEKPAMTQEQVLKAIKIGMTIAHEEAEKGVELIALGEMGIGNTTPSSAIISTITGVPVSTVTGRGTGVDNCGLNRKVAVIEKAIEVNQPDPSDPLDVLMKLGGLEIAGLVGVILGAATHRIPVVLDGLISSAAALIAYEIHPELRLFLLAGHKSVEPGQQAVFERIGLKPILDLNMRLGEGTGAVLASNIIDTACRVLNEMGTFEELGISGVS